MRVPVDVTEKNFPQKNTIYVLGGLLDPQIQMIFAPLYSQESVQIDFS